MELLKFLISNMATLLFVLGIILVAGSWIELSINAAGVSVSSPEKISRKIIVTIVGLSLVLGSGLAIYHDYGSTGGKAKRKETELTYHHSYVSISGSEEECKQGRCRIEFIANANLSGDSSKGALEYIDRIKTNGTIEYIRTSPRQVILNPDQFEKNKTFVEFKMTMPEGHDVYPITGHGIVYKELNAEEGKIGVHVPINADVVAMTVDFRSLPWEIKRSFSPQMEVFGPGGVLQSGLITPKIKYWSNDKLLTVSAANIKAGSSILLKWGY